MMTMLAPREKPVRIVGVSSGRSISSLSWATIEAMSMAASVIGRFFPASLICFTPSRELYPAT